MMALHQIRDVPVRGQEGLSLNLRLASKTPLRRRSIMGLREDTTVSNTGSIHRPGAPTKRKMTMSRLLSLSLSLSPRPAREPPQCPCERTRSSSTLPIYLPTTHRYSRPQSCMQASPSGVSDRSATNKSHTLQTREQQKSRSDGI